MGTIEKKRRELGFTQANLAEKLGINQTAVSKWETGASMPSSSMLPKLAKLFGCTIDALFEITVDGAEVAKAAFEGVETARTAEPMEPETLERLSRYVNANFLE